MFAWFAFFAVRFGLVPSHAICVPLAACEDGGSNIGHCPTTSVFICVNLWLKFLAWPLILLPPAGDLFIMAAWQPLAGATGFPSNVPPAPAFT
jgi:hypothetical protein